MMRGVTDMEHGTRSSYTRGGCRCDLCRAADRKYQRDRRLRDGDRLRQQAKDRYRQNRDRVKAKSRAYYAVNRDKVATYRADNADAIRAYGKRYREANRERLAQAWSDYYAANREELARKQQVYRDENRDELRRRAKEPAARLSKRAVAQRRRARLKNADHGCVNRETLAHLLELSNERCVYCGAKAEHVDHIHPLAKGGAHCVENLVPACGDCNTRKATKILDDPPAPLLICVL